MGTQWQGLWWGVLYFRRYTEILFSIHFIFLFANCWNSKSKRLQVRDIEVTQSTMFSYLNNESKKKSGQDTHKTISVIRASILSWEGRASMINDSSFQEDLHSKNIFSHY